MSPSPTPRKRLRRKPQPNQADGIVTAPQLRLPEWLPQLVADYARALMAWRELGELGPKQRQRLKRLTTDSKMEFVWLQLEREMKNHAAHSNFHPDKLDYAAEAWLRGYLFVAVTADHNATFWQSAQSAREQKATMLRLREIACELIKLLDDPLV